MNTYDALTGLLAHTMIVENSVETARSKKPLVLIIVDLDHLLGWDRDDQPESDDQWIAERFALVCPAR